MLFCGNIMLTVWHGMRNLYDGEGTDGLIDRVSEYIH